MSSRLRRVCGRHETLSPYRRFKLSTIVCRIVSRWLCNTLVFWTSDSFRSLLHQRRTHHPFYLIWQTHTTQQQDESPGNAWSHHTRYHTSCAEVQASRRSRKDSVRTCVGDSDYFRLPSFQVYRFDSQAIEFALRTQSNRVFPQSTIFSVSTFFQCGGWRTVIRFPIHYSKSGCSKSSQFPERFAYAWPQVQSFPQHT